MFQEKYIFLNFYRNMRNWPGFGFFFVAIPIDRMKYREIIAMNTIEPTGRSQGV
jgi:hypothetical protein